MFATHLPHLLLAGLAHATPALPDVAVPPVLQQLHASLLSELGGSSQRAQRLQQAAPSLLAAVTAEGFRRNWLPAGHAGATLAALLAAAGPSAQDGRAAGSAASALGMLLPALVSQGYSPQPDQTPEAVLLVCGSRLFLCVVVLCSTELPECCCALLAGLCQ